MTSRKPTHSKFAQRHPALGVATKMLRLRIKDKRSLVWIPAKLVKDNGAIFVGNGNAAGLAKTRMAKSVPDAGWSAFRTLLKYQCDHAAVWFDGVNESHSTQECCVCHALTGARGWVDLAVRQRSCSACTAQHGRGTNAAKNLLARGLAFMDIAIAGEARAVESAVNESAGASTATGAGHGPLDTAITAPSGR